VIAATRWNSIGKLIGFPMAGKPFWYQSE